MKIIADKVAEGPVDDSAQAAEGDADEQTMDEDDEGHRTRDKICHDLDVLKIPHAVMPPYPGGAKDADEYLMAMRGKEWEFYKRQGSVATDYPLWYTRWL